MVWPPWKKEHSVEGVKELASDLAKVNQSLRSQMNLLVSSYNLAKEKRRGSTVSTFAGKFHFSPKRGMVVVEVMPK